MRKICVISFGNIEEKKNGYHIRCLMIAERLINQGNFVEIYQFSNKNGITLYNKQLAIKSIETIHEKKVQNKGLFKKNFSFSIFLELTFLFESYFRLYKYADQLKNFDEYYLEGCLLIGSFFFIRRYKKPITIDTHCVNKDVALKMRTGNWFAGSLRILIWHIVESALLRRADSIIAVSEKDKHFIIDHYHVTQNKILVIPNEVAPADLQRFSNKAKHLREALGLTNKKVILFIGDLGAIHNFYAENFIREILAPQTPEVAYLIVGNNPYNLENQNNIIYTGFVESIDPYIILTDLCIAPLSLGSGVKTKILDYMKYDKRIVATDIATEGIVSDRDNIVISELRDFGATILSLLK